MYPNLHSSIILTIAKTWKQSKGPPPDEQIKKLWVYKQWNIVYKQWTITQLLKTVK